MSNRYNASPDTITFLTGPDGLETIAGRILRQSGIDYSPLPLAQEEIGGDPLEPEIKQLKGLLDAHEIIKAPYEVIPVDDVGFVITLGDEQPDITKPWLMVDVDDMMIATTAAKGQMAQAYAGYLQRSGLTLDEPGQKRALEMANEFARWDGTYHLSAHIFALAWTTQQLRILPGVPAMVLKDAEEQLAKVKAGTSAEVESQAQVPFYFKDGNLVLTDKDLVSDELLKTFVPITSPDIYPEVARIVQKAGPNGEGKANTAIFTYGQPYFQLLKLLSAMNRQHQEQEPLQPSQIWLTTVKKGDFLQRIVEKFDTTDPAASIASTLVESPVLLLADDDPMQLTSFLETELDIKKGALRSVRRGTKTAGRQWVYSAGNMALVHDADEEDPSNLEEKISYMIEVLAKQLDVGEEDNADERRVA